MQRFTSSKCPWKIKSFVTWYVAYVCGYITAPSGAMCYWFKSYDRWVRV